MLLYFVSHIKCFHLDTWPKMKNEKKLECFLRIWALLLSTLLNYRSSHPEVFLRKGVLEICSKFTGEHPCRGGISITLNGNFIEITLRHGCSPVNLQHIFRTTFLKNTSGRLFLYAGDNTLKSKRELATDLCQQIELTSELKSDLWDVVDCGRKWFNLFNAGKCQLVSFDRCNNFAVDVKMGGSIFKEK